MINENLKLSGQLNIVLKDKAGNIKENIDTKNLVVNTGLAYIVSRMVGTTKAVMTHMAVGSGTTAAAATQTDLVTLLGSREALDSTTISGKSCSSLVLRQATGQARSQRLVYLTLLLAETCSAGLFSAS